jgi:uncharacterized protein (TIGR03437 family)
VSFVYSRRSQRLALNPGSMSMIFGRDLAKFVASSQPPWMKSLGGVEVHFADDNCFELSCELSADLIYVSPTQINFVAPKVPVLIGDN